MAHTIAQQLDRLFRNAKHVLVVFAHTDGDSLASANALADFLHGYNVRVDMVSPGYTPQHRYQFLSRSKDISPTLPHLHKFIISLDVADAGIEELSYDVKDKKLNIFITPKSGSLHKEHIQTAQTEFRYDLIVTVNTPDLDSLAELYEGNRDLFDKIPIVNIDHRSENEHYGQLNIVNVKACATSEMLFALFEEIAADRIDEPIATALLTGMIVNTNSFKSEHVNPQTLRRASTLVALGGRRQFVVEQLYQTKSLAMLRLWGEALSHLAYEKELGLVSSIITRDDFVRTGASEHDLQNIIDELIMNSPEERMTLLVHEHPTAGTIHALFHAERPTNAMQLMKPFGAVGNDRQVSMVFEGKNLKEVQELITDHIRKEAH